METLQKIEIPKTLISQEKAIDTIYDINTKSPLNQLMFKLIKSEALIKRCKERISKKINQKNRIGAFFGTNNYLKSRIDFLNEVLERLINYRYNIMNQLNERLNNVLMKDIDGSI